MGTRKSILRVEGIEGQLRSRLSEDLKEAWLRLSEQKPLSEALVMDIIAALVIVRMNGRNTQ